MQGGGGCITTALVVHKVGSRDDESSQKFASLIPPVSEEIRSECYNLAGYDFIPH